MVQRVLCESWDSFVAGRRLACGPAAVLAEAAARAVVGRGWVWVSRSPRSPEPQVPANLLLVKNTTMHGARDRVHSGARLGTATRHAGLALSACVTPARTAFHAPRHHPGVFWGSYMQHQPRVLRASMDHVSRGSAS
jgi:hypothetical protein